MATYYELDKAGKVSWIGDGHHNGSEVYWSEQTEKWVVVDLESQTVTRHDRLALYRSERDGDETGLHACCVAADLDGSIGTWLVPIDEDFADEPVDGVEKVWDSEAIEVTA